MKGPILAVLAFLIATEASPANAQMTAGELEGFAALPAQPVDGAQVQTVWLKGFIAGLRTAAEITEAGRVKEIVDVVYECIADYSNRTVLSLFSDWLKANPEYADGPARDAMFLALLQHCVR